MAHPVADKADSVMANLCSLFVKARKRISYKINAAACAAAGLRYGQQRKGCSTGLVALVRLPIVVTGSKAKGAL